MQILKTQQNLSKKLTFQQINFIKLLQLNGSDISSRIAKEIEVNPLLEYKETEDDTPGYQCKVRNYSNNFSQNKEIFYKNIEYKEGLHDKLKKQLEYLSLHPNRYKIAEHILGNIDKNGYLRCSLEDIKDDFSLTYYEDISIKEIENVLNIIQNFDPPGLGARNLQECLLIQLSKCRSDLDNVELAKAIVKNYFIEFANKNYSKIIKNLEIEPEKLNIVYNIIKHLNPKPGLLFDSYSTNSVNIPDFIIKKIDEDLLISLAKDNIPTLRVNNRYKSLSENLSGRKNEKLSKDVIETKNFIKNKLNSALWFIDAIKQRQQTMLNVMNAIVKLQKKFFLDENIKNLKPLILKDIANEINMDISTVSRVVSSKYVQTQNNLYPLKFFFSESLKTQKGADVSNREIKESIKIIIDNEDKTKPYTDDQITDKLIEKGYNVARRTVTKYRKFLQLSIARLRKEIV